MTENIQYTLDPEKFSKSLKQRSLAESTKEIPNETLEKGVDTSTNARTQAMSVFQRFNNPLNQPSSNGTENGFPIVLEVGGKKTSYRPQGTISDTGGVHNDFRRGKGIVDNTTASLLSWEKQLQSTGEQFRWNQEQSLGWERSYNDINNQLNNFYQENTPTLQDGYRLIESGQAAFQPDGKGGWTLARTEGSNAPQDVIDRYNAVNAIANQYSMDLNNAYRNYRYYEEQKGYDIERINYAQINTINAANRYSEAEKMRYRYLLSGVDLDKKIEASKNGFAGIFNREYTTDAVRENYYKSMDTLGGFMSRMQSGQILTEQDFQKDIQEIGTTLTPEEKIIFLSMVGSNLENLTYNWDKVKSGKLTSVKPFESMQALAKAYQTGTEVPAGVCSSIHVAVSTIAEMWGTPAGTVTVSSNGVGHVVSIMNIGGKHVLSDYGKIYTAPTIEELLDNYGKSKNSVLIRNYITDASGKIIGHIETPMTKEFRKVALSETELAKMLETGEMPKNGVQLSLYNGAKSLKGKYTFNNGVYIGGKYSEAELIQGVNAKTIALTVGKKWDDIPLGNDWKGQAFVEGHISQSGMKFDGVTGDTKPTIGQIQAGIRGQKEFTGGHTAYIGAGLRVIGQGSRPKNSDFKNLPVVGTGTTGESGLNISAGGTYQMTPDTRIGLDGKVITNTGVNVQSVGPKDFNPLGGQQYISRTGSIGIETKVGDGYITGVASQTRGPLSKERTIGIGYTNGTIGGRVESRTIEGTRIFGPTNQDIIRVNIEGTFGKEKNGEWFVGVENGGLGGKKGSAGVKYKF